MSSVTLVRLLSQIFILPVLARYLSPEDYGIVAIAMPIILFGMIFTDAGMSQSLIKAQKYDHREWSTCFWMMGALGAVLCLLLSGAGYVIALFMHEPSLFPIIVVLSSVIFLQSVTTVPAVSLQQSNRFGALAAAEMIATVMGLVAALGTALAGWGAWALVIQQIALYVTKLVTTFAVTRFVPVFEFHKNLLTRHLHFGRDLLGGTIADLLKNMATNMVMGKVLGTPPLGHYSMGMTFAELPRRLSSGPVTMVLYPRFAALVDDPEKLRVLFLLGTRGLAFLLVPLIGMLALAQAPIFALFLTEKWALAGQVFMLAAPATMFVSVTGLQYNLLKSFDKTPLMLRFAVEGAVLQLLVLGVTIWFGLYWAVAGITLTTSLFVFRPLWAALRLIDLSMKTYFSVFIVPCLGLIIFGGIYVVCTSFFTWTDWEKLGAAVALGAACLVFNFALSWKSFFAEARQVRGYMT